MSEFIRNLTSQDIRQATGLYRVEVSDKPLTDLTASLEQEIFGQSRAMRAFARSLLRARAGMSSPHRPEFSALFLGPSGVGKTESARALTKILHPNDNDWEKYLKIIDCGSSLTEDHTVSKLVGSPPGYVGSGNPNTLLIPPDFMQANQKTVLVMDEFDKAHPAIWRMFLSVLDRGELQVTAGSGQYSSDTRVRKYDFANTYIIFTSNIGSRDMLEAQKGHSLGFHTENATNKQIYQVGLKAVQQHFASCPEFLNRLDEQIIFDPLTPESYRRILDRYLNEYNQQTAPRNFLTATREFKDQLLTKVNLTEGGRGLKRLFEKDLLTKAALATMSIEPGQPLIADVEGQEVFFWSIPLKDKECESPDKEAA